MIFTPTPLLGAYLIGLEPRSDKRGIFARAFCAQEFQVNGLESSFVQANISVNKFAGIVRGLHFQRQPHTEVKLVRCIKGLIYDVIVDFREESSTYLQWFSAELSEENGLMMYVPKGFAHGYQSLMDGSSAFYMVSSPYAPGAEDGLRYDDPKIGITWPLPVSNVSEKDRKWPLISVSQSDAKHGV